jgi:hypothetical protein
LGPLLVPLGHLHLDLALDDFTLGALDDTLLKPAVRPNNEAVDKQQVAYMAGSADAVAEYCEMVLSASDYPD